MGQELIEMVIARSELVALLLSSGALLVSLLAAIFTMLAYLRKSGERFRASFTVQRSSESPEPHVRSVTVENTKDRSVVIFGVFLRIGYNFLIELENLDDEPVQIEPYGIYHREYDPPVFYDVQGYRFQMKGLLFTRRYRKYIVLSTSQGKQQVRARIRKWDAIVDYFTNRSVTIIRPQKAYFDGRAYGSAVKYIIKFRGVDGETETRMVRDPNSVPKPQFLGDLQIPDEALKSKDTLQEFLQTKRHEGQLKFDEASVTDFGESVDKRFALSKRPQLKEEPIGWWEYNVTARIISYRERRRERKRQRNRVRQRIQSRSADQ